MVGMEKNVKYDRLAFGEYRNIYNINKSSVVFLVKTVFAIKL